MKKTVALLTENGVLKRYLASLYVEWGFTVLQNEGEASLLLVDLDTAQMPQTALATVTLSSNPFRDCDLLRPFSLQTLYALTLEKLGIAEDAAPVLPRASLSEREKVPPPCELPELTLGEGGFLYGGEFTALSPAEYRLFSLLFAHRGEAVSLQACKEALADGDSVTKSNALSVYIHYLREKLDYRINKRMILTLRGRGYMLAE